MNGEELRKSILLLAFTGKLTPDFNYPKNSVHTLLKEAAKEKERAIESGKFKKDSAAKKIDLESFDFDLPERWALAKIGSFSAVYNGDSINAEEKKTKYTKKTEGWNYIATKDVGFDSTIDYKNGIIIPYSNSYFKVAYKDSVLMCMEGGSAGRKIGILNQDVCFGNKLCCFYSFKIVPEYLFYYLQSPLFLCQFKDAVSGLIGGVGAAKIKEMIIPIPSLDEQIKIVDSIKEIFPKVQLFDSLNEQLNSLNEGFVHQMRKSVLRYAMQGRLVAQDKNDEPIDGLLKEIHSKQLALAKKKIIKIGKYDPIINDTYEDLPNGWKYIKIGDIANLVTKQTGFDYSNVIKPSLISHYEPNTLPLIQTRNFKGKNFIFDSAYYVPEKVAEEYPNLVLNKKCLLLSIVGASIGNVGYFDFDRIGFVGGAIAKIDLTDNVLFDYLYYFLQSPLGFAEIMKNYKANAQGTITVEDVRNIVVPFPPLNEQKRIIEQLEEILEKLDTLNI